MTFGKWDWLILVAVPIMALVIQKAFGQQTGWRGYFFATKATGRWQGLATLFGANITFTSIFLILSEKSYNTGPIVFAVPIFWVGGTFLFVSLLPKIFPHIIQGRLLHQTIGFVFNSRSLQKLAALWTIIAFVGTVALEFYGGTLLLRWLQVPSIWPETVALLFAIVTLLLTMRGGFRGVAIADLFLSFVILVGLAILIGYLLYAPVVKHVPFVPAPPTGAVEAVSFIAGMAVLFLPFQFCTLDSWQRLGAWEGREERLPGDYLAGSFGVALAFCVPIIIGLWVRQLGYDANTTVHPLKTFLEDSHLASFFIGIVFAGFVAAILSTADELLNCCSYSLIFDLLSVPRPELGSSAEIKLIATGKLYTGIFGFVAAALSLFAIRYPQKITDMAIAVFSTQIVFIIPVMIALFRPQRAKELTNKTFYSTLIGYSISIACVVIGWANSIQPLVDGAPVIGLFFAGLPFLPLLGRICSSRSV